MPMLYRVCARRPCWRTKSIEDICIKIEYISQRKIIVLFRSSNMAVVHTLYSICESYRGKIKDIGVNEKKNSQTIGRQSKALLPSSLSLDEGSSNKYRNKQIQEPSDTWNDLDLPRQVHNVWPSSDKEELPQGRQAL